MTQFSSQVTKSGAVGMNPALPIPNSGLEDLQLLPLVLKQFFGRGACRDGAHCLTPSIVALPGWDHRQEGSWLILPLCRAAEQPNSSEQPPVPPVLTQQGTSTMTCPKATVQCCATAQKTHLFIISKRVTLLLGGSAQRIPTQPKHHGTAHTHSCMCTHCGCNKSKVGMGRRLRTDPVCSQDNVSPKAGLGFLDSVLLLKIYGLRKLPEPGSLDLPPFQPRVYQDTSSSSSHPLFSVLRGSVLRLPKPALSHVSWCNKCSQFSPSLLLFFCPHSPSQVLQSSSIFCSLPSPRATDALLLSLLPHPWVPNCAFPQWQGPISAGIGQPGMCITNWSQRRPQLLAVTQPDTVRQRELSPCTGRGVCFCCFY